MHLIANIRMTYAELRNARSKRKCYTTNMAKGVAVQPLRTNKFFIHTHAQINFLPCYVLQKRKVV